MVCIGIDLGTSNSAAAVMRNGSLKIIPSAEGLAEHGKMFPSVVTFTSKGAIVGKAAKKLAQNEHTITNIKRRMGSKYVVKINNRKYTPQEISAFILKKIKRDAEIFLGEPVDKAVITCPAYFNDNQRTATRDAGLLAGLEVARIINEPTAASLAYGLERFTKDLKIAVLDIGGGTFDVTLLELCDSVFKVVATNGDTQLGGIDMDKRIVDYLVAKLNKKGVKLGKAEMQKLRFAAENAKINLSFRRATSVNLLSIDKCVLTREKMEKLIAPVVKRIRAPIQQALSDANLLPHQIDKILLVGGPTKMPILRAKVREIFGKEAERGIDPMHCVALGAAIQASMVRGKLKDIVLLDVTPLSLGIETAGSMFTKLIPRNTTIPVDVSQTFTTAQDYQTTVPIHVLQGERALAHDNISLGVFNLRGIKPAPRHEPMIEVTFSIDVNGILNVSAEDLETEKRQIIEIESPAKLPRNEIERMIKEAAVFAEVDREKEEKIRYRQRAEALVYELGKLPNELPYEKKNIEKPVRKLKHALARNDFVTIKNQVDKLTKLLEKIEAKSRVKRQASGLINLVRAMAKKKKIARGEKENMEAMVEKLEHSLPTHDIEKIEKQVGELKEMLSILEMGKKR